MTLKRVATNQIDLLQMMEAQMLLLTEGEIKAQVDMKKVVKRMVYQKYQKALEPEVSRKKMNMMKRLQQMLQVVMI